MWIYLMDRISRSRRKAREVAVKKRSRSAFLAAGLVLSAGSAHGQATEQWREWNRPVEPFRIVEGVYYVGASDIASYLITTEEGHIVIDGGFAETAPLILDSVTRLGFEPSGVKVLLNSHAHLDHAGGLAELKRVTGARLVISEGDADAIESGGRTDLLMGGDAGTHFPPASVDRRIRDGETVTFGGVTLTAHVTAGHTRGCTTWTMPVEEGGRKLEAVFVCSLTILPAARLLDRPSYPGIAEDYAASIARLKSLSGDVFLAAHAGFFDMRGKLERRAAGEAGNPFVDPVGYRAYVERAEIRYHERLQEEREGVAPRVAVERLLGAYNAHDVQGVSAMVTEDFRWYSVDGGSVSVEVAGREALAAALEAYFASFPTAKSTLEQVMESGKYVIVHERAHWTRDGVDRSQSALAVYEVRAGRVAAVWYYPAEE
jgi:metallo-beta-lactamase class B